MKEIPLTQGKVALVDDADYTELNQFKWYALKDHSGNFYAVRHPPKIDGKQHMIYMHRQILGLEHGDPREIDHRDHNTLDNRRGNIRICTNQQNQMNRKPGQNKTSKLKGVYFHKQNKEWQACIRIDSEGTYLGLYDDEEMAGMAYDLVARKVFGQYAKLNFLPPCVSLC